MLIYLRIRNWWPEMPNRILREGILSSERIARLKWPEEVFYRRLMSVVDDYGRYYATPMLLRAACYPQQLNVVSDSDIEKWLTKCVEAALVRVYPAQDGKRYVELLDFKQQVRAKVSKFPQMLCTCTADDKQTGIKCAACAHLDVFEGVSVSGGVSEDGDEDDKRARKKSSIDRPPDVMEETWDDFLALRSAKKAPVTKTAIDKIDKEAGKAGISLQAALEECCARGWTGFKADWLADKGKHPVNGQPYEAPWERASRERMQALAPGAARKTPGDTQSAGNIIDEVRDAVAIPSR